MWPGAGPDCQCLWSPASPPAAGARHLVGPADWSGTKPTGRSRRWRVWLVADHCSRVANDAGSVSGVWLQSRRLVGDHCSHTMSYLVDGPRVPREELAACWRLASLRSGWSGFRHLPGSRCLVGPAAYKLYRQVVVGNRTPPIRSDVKEGVATVLRRAEISACTGHCSHVKPKIRG